MSTDVSRLRRWGTAIWFATALTGFVLTPTMYGQLGSARIRGVVSDPTGAPVAGASVSIKNTQTGAASATKSNGIGEFSFPDLPIGRYEIRVQANDFKEFVQHDIALVADQNFSVNVRLQVGQVNETVTVSAASAQVDTQTGTLKDTINTQQIEDLPLNGRNPLQLVALSAGVFETGGGSNNQSSTVPGESFFSIDGQRTNTVNFELDGSDHNDPYTNVANPMPNPDALAEFSVQTSNYDAEYGRNSGGIVNAITKSGTNSFHGSAFEFIRNGDVNARNFFSTTNTDTLTRNQFGATLGGPVVVPRLYNGKDKSFFFFSYQGTRIHSASSSGFLTVPTSAEASGDFSGLSPIIDPNTGKPFPDNQIPPGRIDPYATKTLSLIYPSLDTSTRHYYIQPNRTQQDEFLVRGDQNISDTEHLTLRYFHWNYITPPYAASAGEYPASTVGEQALNHNASIILTSTLSPRLVNLLSVGFNRLFTNQTLPPYVSSREIGLNVFSQPPDPMTLSIAGLSGVSFQPPVPNTRNTYTIQNSTTLTIGKHLITWGGEIQRIQQKWTFNEAFPNYDFSGYYTGNGFADFLLGKPYYLYEGGYQEMDTRFTGWALFAQDNYKLTRKLTFDLGLRWDPWIPPHYVGTNKIVDFSPADAVAGIHSIVYPDAPPGILYYGDPGVPSGGTNSAWTNFAPRLGFAYALTEDNKTVLRGAYGIFYDQPKDIMWNHANDNPPFGAVAYLLAGVNPPYSYEDPFHGQPNPILNIFSPNNNSFPATPINGLFFFSTFHMPTIQQWNLSLERALPWGIVARASYVGSHGTHLIWVRDADPPLWTSDSTQTNIQQRRPYNPILGYTNTPFFDSWSKYNALEISVNRRFSQGFTVTVNYTREKSMDDHSDSTETIWFNPVDPYNLHLEKGESDFDLPNNFVASFVWQLPIPEMHSRLLNAGLRGWQANGIFSIRSGTPITIYSYDSVFPTGLTFQRPIQVLQNPYLNNNGSINAMVNGYLNPAAFANPNPNLPYPQIYDDVVGRNALRGPNFRELDMSIFKNIKLFESAQLQIRAEAFNVFNNVNLENPSSYYVDINFGKIFAAFPSRQLQAAVRISF